MPLKQLTDTLIESIRSVLPISAIVLILSITLSPMQSGVLVLFLFGTILLIFGMALFTIGSNTSMHPLGVGIGVQLHKSKKSLLPLLACFLLGVIITIAEPDLQVLARQIPSIPNLVLILAVAIGVGIFLMVTMVRAKRRLPLNLLLLIFYGVLFLLAFFAPEDFIPAAFDSGGVTTGPITVPFIMALGAGLATTASQKNEEGSFGLVALCSIGPILSVLLLSLFYTPDTTSSEIVIGELFTTKDAFQVLWHALPEYAWEVFIAMGPIALVFILFELVFRRFHRHEVFRIAVGLLYTYAGLVLFLTGANAGFMPAGKLLGAGIAQSSLRYALIPVGLLMGWFVVSAEPAVHVLKKQVEEVTSGAISQKAMGIGLSIGVGIAVAISMARVLTGIPLFPILLVGYILSLGISFFVPPVYTGIAFDSGGVASGPMTTAFMLPFAIGACEALGGDIMTDAFGLVAMVAMAPLITIQSMGLISRIHHKAMLAKAAHEINEIPDTILCFDRQEILAASIPEKEGLS